MERPRRHHLGRLRYCYYHRRQVVEVLLEEILVEDLVVVVVAHLVAGIRQGNRAEGRKKVEIQTIH